MAGIRMIAGPILASALVLAAQSAPPMDAAAPSGPAPMVQLDVSEVLGRSFEVGGTRLTVLQWRTPVPTAAKVAAVAAMVVAPPLAAVTLGYPANTITLRIENTTGQFRDYAPKDFLLVGQDGTQFMLDQELGHGEERKPAAVPLAPHAFVERTYRFSQELQFPATLYFQRTALARINQPASASAAFTPGRPDYR